MRIYIDVTNITKINFLTGIQRVVREILLGMFNNNYDICLITWNNKVKKYFIIDSDSFKKFIYISNKENIIITNDEWDYTRKSTGESIFFDIDKLNHLYSIQNINQYQSL